MQFCLQSFSSVQFESSFCRKYLVIYIAQVRQRRWLIEGITLMVASMSSTLVEVLFQRDILLVPLGQLNAQSSAGSYEGQQERDKFLELKWHYSTTWDQEELVLLPYIDWDSPPADHPGTNTVCIVYIEESNFWPSQNNFIFQQQVQKFR